MDSPKADAKVKVRVTDLRGEGEPGMEVKKRLLSLLLPLLGKPERGVEQSWVIPPSITELRHLCTVSYWVLVVFWYFPSAPGADSCKFDPTYENTKS